jgi:aspartate carbamoyltransferase catalytic subunit
MDSGFFMAKPEQINGNFKGKDILSLDQFDKPSIQKLFNTAAKIKESIPSNALSNMLTTLLFYEPSSRTFGSFSAAIKRLGGLTIEIQNAPQTSSVAKGETLEDTVKVFASYSDAIIIRHPEMGSAQKAANAVKVPVINAGDGAGEHPTQALLDLFTIYEKQGKLDGITILFAGDIKNGRTVHSLLRGLTLYSNVTVFLLSPQLLSLSKDEYNAYTKRGLTIIEITSETQIPKDANVWYWTRVQKERFDTISEYEKTKDAFILTEKLLQTYGNNEMVIMHPLPRVGEIVEAIDSDPRAIYLTEQMKNGMYIRMALMGLVLGKV